MDFSFLQLSMALVPAVFASAYASKKKGKNPLGMTSKYIESRTFQLPVSELRAAALTAIQYAGFRNVMVSTQTGDLRAEAALSIWSFGEKIQVSFETTRKGSALTFVSVCALPIQVFAWGKNKRNAQRFFRQLQVELAKSVVEF